MLTISVVGNTFAQTILNRFPIELKKSSSYYQILNGENQQNDYFAFIAEKQKITVLKYNSALFFTDSLSVRRTDKDLDFLAGVTFSADGNPNLYLSSRDYETIKSIHFDFRSHTVSDLNYKNEFKSERVVDLFSANNSLQIISASDDNQLKFTVFSTEGKKEQLVSLTPNTTSDEKSRESSFTSLIFENGIVAVDSKLFTPLYVGVSKVKRYLSEKKVALSFDDKFQTTVFEINLDDFSVVKNQFPYEKFEDDSKSNSFLNQGILYQLTANSKALSLSGFDFETKEKIASYQADAKNEIDFKNSPLLIQSDNGKSRELKKTAKLLSKIDFGNVGLSVYSTPNYNLFTIGGIREVASGGQVALGIGVVLGGIIGGVAVDPNIIIDNGNAQSIFFESYFDSNFKHSKAPFRPLYIDALSEFLNKTQPAVQNIYPFKNYVILNYYDGNKKEFVMRKFEDITE